MSRLYRWKLRMRRVALERICNSFAYRLRTAERSSTISRMDTLDGRLVVVSAGRLDDLLELARAASERLPDSDPLRTHLRAAAAQVRAEAIPEP